MDLIKLTFFAVGGAITASAAAAFGGIGVVAGGAAVGLSALEVAVIGGAAGTTIYKIREDEAEAQRKTTAANKAKRVAVAKQTELTNKIQKAREVLDDLEADTAPEPEKTSVFVKAVGTTHTV
jgi:threonine dehydrogenase-like Zn-dependent dehydrogenase